MPISDINPQSYHLYITSKNFKDLLDILKIGDIVKGRVAKKLGQGKFIVNYLGRNVVTQSSLDFKQTDIIYAKVTDISDKVTMRLVEGEVKGLGAALSESEGKELLSKLNIKVSEENINIFKTLSLFNLKVNKENVLLMQSKIKEFGLSSLDEMKSLAWLLSKNIPLTQENTHSVKMYLFEHKLLGENMQEIEQSLKQNFSAVKDLNIKSFIDLINNTKVKVEQENLAGQLENFVRNSGLNYESKIRNLFLSEGLLKDKAEIESKPFSLDKGSRELLASAKNLLDKIADGQNPELTRLAKEVSTVLNKGISTNRDFEKVVLNLAEMERQDKNPQLRQFLNNLGESIGNSKNVILIKNYQTLVDLSKNWGQLKTDFLNRKDSLFRELLNFIEKDVKYFFYSRNEQALNKIINRMDSFVNRHALPAKELADFKSSLQQVRQLIKEDIVTDKDSFFRFLSKVPQERKVDIRKRLNIIEDFKGIIYKAREYFESHLKNNPEFYKSQSFDRTMDSLNRAIRYLQGEQLSNLKTDDNYVYYSFQVPLSSKESLDTAKIEIYYKKKEGDDGKAKAKDDSIKIAFFLDMSILGPLKILADIEQEKINCRIKVSDDKIKNFIDKNILDLKNGFKALDYELGNIECLVEPNEEFDMFEPAISEVTARELSRINIIV